jgi:tripartite-type tricarboxylate transporter receptor subunit TctC
MPQQPQVPTTREAGLADFEMSSWFGLLAPAGTPAAIVQKLHADTVQALAETQIKARLYVQGMTPVAGSSEDFAKQIDDELVRWGQVVAARKLKLK